MVSEFEKKVRKLDDENLRVYESARRIAKKLNKNYGTITSYLQAKREGFKDHSKYLSFRALLTGFEDRNDYALYSYHHKKGNFKDSRDFQKRKGLNKRLSYVDPKLLDRFTSNNKSLDLYPLLEREKEIDRREVSETLDYLISKLPREYQGVIRKSFYQGKSGKKIGRELKTTPQNISLILKSALKKLYYLAKQYNLQELYEN